MTIEHARIAIVDDETVVCRRLSQILIRDGYEAEAFTNARALLERLRERAFDLVLLDLRLPDMDGLAALPRIKAINEDTEVIMVTGYGSIDTAIRAIKDGAYHYAVKPLKLEEIRMLVRGALDKIAMRRENLRLREALAGGGGLSAFVGNGPALEQVFALIRKVAPVDCNVLLQGPSGTGKALAARAIHDMSPRADRPFVCFNCGGFTEELIAGELFGHEKGSFTGATATRAGLFESADGGTVFLDEIGEMPLSMQVKLLHVIQEKRILRVGGTKPINLDIRILAATNKDLKHESAEGNFREDLFFRLNVVSISLPPLSAHREDIPLLVRHFIEKYGLAFRKKISGIQPQALQILNGYSYPGNVRELENIVERAVALVEDGGEIRPQDLPQDLQELEFDTMEGEGLLTLEELEKRYIAKVLEKTGYNKGLTAQILDVPRTTLWRKLKGLGIE